MLIAGSATVGKHWLCSPDAFCVIWNLVETAIAGTRLRASGKWPRVSLNLGGIVSRFHFLSLYPESPSLPSIRNLAMTLEQKEESRHSRKPPPSWQAEPKAKRSLVVHSHRGMEKSELRNDRALWLPRHSRRLFDAAGRKDFAGFS